MTSLLLAAAMGLSAAEDENVVYMRERAFRIPLELSEAERKDGDEPEHDGKRHHQFQHSRYPFARMACSISAAMSSGVRPSVATTR